MATTNINAINFYHYQNPLDMRTSIFYDKKVMQINAVSIYVNKTQFYLNNKMIISFPRIRIYKNSAHLAKIQSQCSEVLYCEWEVTTNLFPFSVTCIQNYDTHTNVSAVNLEYSHR